MLDTSKRSDDIPINKMCFYAALAGVGAFCFFQLASCTKTYFSTPDFVQAIQACNSMLNTQLTVHQDGKIDGHWSNSVDISPEVLATLQKCHENVRENFASVPKPVLDRYMSPDGTLGSNLKELLTKKPE